MCPLRYSISVSHVCFCPTAQTNCHVKKRKNSNDTIPAGTITKGRQWKNLDILTIWSGHTIFGKTRYDNKTWCNATIRIDGFSERYTKSSKDHIIYCLGGEEGTFATVYFCVNLICTILWAQCHEPMLFVINTL